MDYILIGKVSSTHGIKGEIKLLSDFPYKQKVFKKNNILIIDHKEYLITNYRTHKNFDLITLDGYTSINDVEHLLRKKVYIKKENLELSSTEILDEELITYKVLTTNNKRGIIKEIFSSSPKTKIIRVEIEKKEILIPYHKNFIKKINKETKEIFIDLIDGM